MLRRSLSPSPCQGRSRLALCAVLAVLVLLLASVIQTHAAQKIHRSHAIAMSGEPKYGPDFQHFDYADPNAPKYGTALLSAIGTFDSFNPFITKGVPASGVGLIYDTLTVQSADEPFTEYGLLAKEIEWPEDRSWVTFHLDPEARFHDGRPVTASDVDYTFKLLTTQGSPLYKQYYASVDKVEILSERSIKFSFRSGENQELPLILGQMTVLPKHFWQERDFEASSLEVPLGSGPYRLASFRPGHSVRYERVESYWAKDHPAMKGRYNFNTLGYDYYRDSTVAIQAFKAGEYDFRQETSSKDWATAYTGQIFDEGHIVKAEIPHQNPAGMQGFVFNTRRDLFADRRVRLALTYAFDFEWSNRNLFYGQYTRSESYFANSELAAQGLPSERELEILEPYRDDLPPEVFERVYRAPSTDGNGDASRERRRNLRRALELLREAGWTVKNGTLMRKGKPFEFELLLISPAFERVALPFARNLERLGITMNVRLVDTSQYLNRLREFDFDMIVFPFGQSISPGNEQRYFWHSSSSDQPGSYNFPGIRSTAIDALVERVIAAPDREELVQRVRALDRALLWGYYVIPHWHAGYYRVAYWNKFEHPATPPKYDLGFYTWWVDRAKEATLAKVRGKLKRDGD